MISIGYTQHVNYETLLHGCWGQGTVCVCVSACACDTEGEDKSDEADLRSWWRWCLHKSAIAEELTES